MKLLIEILDLIGSACALAILCFCMVFIIRSRKVKISTLASYIVVSVIMFIVLLRT